MKKQFLSQSPGPTRGFTLVELLIVISLVALLAGLSVVAIRGIQTQANRSKTQAHMAAIKTGLEKYNTDYGVYPRPSESVESQSTTVAGQNVNVGGAVALYQALGSDGDDAIEGGSSGSQGRAGSNGSNPYWSDVNPESNIQKVVKNEGSTYYLVDAWSYPFQYKVAPQRRRGESISSADKQKYKNVGSYDLWSYAAQIENVDAWITNWK
jgi:prepilin-type N-terminal cleavage/methylation domain-containing protein